MVKNKLLAEYVGFKTKEFTWNNKRYLIPDDTDPVMDDDIQFWNPEKNWDQLMMIVEEIEKQDFVNVIIGRNTCEITFPHPADKYGRNLDSVHKYGETKIGAVFIACVGYIQIKLF